MPTPKLVPLAMIAALLAAAPTFAGDVNEDVFTPMGLGGGGGIFSPAVSPHDPDFMLISTDMGGAYRSTNGGKSWSQIHYSQLANAAGNKASIHPLILKDEVYWQGCEIWQSPRLMVSRDKGKTWSSPAASYPWGKDRIQKIAAIESSPLVLFAGNENGFWKSTDHAKTWEPIAPAGTDGKKCNSIITVGATVLACLDTSLVHSRDAGATWEKLTVDAANGKPLLCVAAGQTKTRESILYVVAQEVGTLQSTDFGKTWSVVQKWDNQNDVQMAANQTQIAYTAQSDGAGKKVWVTKDGGKTWGECFPPGKNSQLDWVQHEMKWDYRLMHAGVFVSATDPKLIMTSSVGDAYISRDAGESWVPLTTGVADLPKQPGNPYRRYKTNGLQVTGCYSFHVDPSDPRRLFAGHSDIGLIRSIDKGDTWSSVAYRGSPWFNSFYMVAFDPFDKNKLYAAASNYHDIPDWRKIDDLGKVSGGVVVSTDGGDTWKKLWALSPEKVITSLIVDKKQSPDAQHVTMYAAAYDDGVYKTTDSGKTWLRKSEGLGYPGNARVHRVVLADSGNLYAVIAGRKKGRVFSVPGGLWKSTDKGETWTDLTKDLKLLWPSGYVAIDPQDENTLLLTASSGPGCEKEGGVWKSTDGGKSWKHTLTPEIAGKYSSPPNAVQCWDVRFNAADPNIAYLGTTFQGLWYSKDKGSTWHPYKQFPHYSALSAQIDPSDPKTIYVSTFGGGLWRGPALPPK